MAAEAPVCSVCSRAIDDLCTHCEGCNGLYHRQCANTVRRCPTPDCGKSISDALPVGARPSGAGSRGTPVALILLASPLVAGALYVATVSDHPWVVVGGTCVIGVLGLAASRWLGRVRS